MKTRFLSTIVLLAAVATISCNRDDNKNKAGKGGNAVLRIVPIHHTTSKNLVDLKVYIRYNAQDAPSFYDDSVATVQVDGQPTAVFNGLKTGNYYIYGYGYDTSIKQNVKGGIPYVVSSETTLSISLPVSEVHQ